MCAALKTVLFQKQFKRKKFDADAIVFKKKYLENMKKRPSKVAHNRPPIFFMYWPGCPNGPETEIHYHQKPLNAGLGI